MTTNLRIVIAGPVSLDDESGLQPSVADALWIDVPAGSTKSPGDGEEFLSCDTSGAQTTINLRAAAAANDGEIQLIKCSGNMLSPVIVNAGAATTVELLNAPGTYGASTWMPIQGQTVFFKYDKATTQWKAWCSYEGSGTVGQSSYNPGWYAQTNIQIDPAGTAGGIDSNVGGAGAPLRTYAEAVRRWGVAQVPPGTTVTFLTSQVDDSDPVVVLVRREGQAILKGAAPTVITAGVMLAGVTARNRTAGANSELIANLGATAVVGQLVRNTTAGKSSIAIVKSALGGGSFELTQPNVPMVAGATTPPTQVNTWANGDTVDLLQPVAVAVTQAGGMDGGRLAIYQMTVFDPGAPGTNICELGEGMLVQECVFQRAFNLATQSTVAWIFSVLKLGGATHMAGLVAIVAGGTAGNGTETFNNTNLVIDGDYCSDINTIFIDGLVAIGFAYLGFLWQIQNSQVVLGNTFYGGHCVYGRAAKNWTQTGRAGTFNGNGSTWAAAMTFPTAIAGGIFMNGGQLAQTHTNASPDVVTSNVATTVANADAATEGAMQVWGGSSIRKGG